MNYRLQRAVTDNLPQVLPLVQAYHLFENIQMTDESRNQAVGRLLSDSSLGGIWLIVVDTAISGYIALTFGYSIEFGGKDAFIDEFYIRPEFRGQGLGKHTLSQIQQEAKLLNIRALHLEVARLNTRAQKLYAQTNFQTRNKYMLMSARLT
ncbi:acetyltransferase [Leptolyngbya sp. Heron Island J]|uniref:GNAT family N-acetyltransferase n=1 Tax=Leptolyngbya sp. Heron Island J TaxID=1385935 RepID=UPI0003B9700F|nr:GNAT family N-acetyltransferase [Leptolyngbya sp. Heron Island J]ESA38389.1 acetyltransferase [Leptolyngbya sp. Heron Island J]